MLYGCFMFATDYAIRPDELARALEDRGFESWAPAYRVGYEGRMRYGDTPFDELDSVLQQDYLRLQGNDMSWDEVRPATRAAWERVDRRVQNLTGN